MGRHGLAKSLREPTVEGRLRDRLVVDGVVDFARPAALQGGDDGADHIRPVDHVDDPQTVAVDAGFVAAELLEEVPAVRAVDAGDTENHAGKTLLDGRKDDVLRFNQNLAGRALGLRRAGFFHRGTIGLPVDAGAAGVDILLQRRRLPAQPRDKVAGAFYVDLLVDLRSAFAGGNQIYDPVEGPGQRRQVLRPRDVAGEGLDADSLQLRRAFQRASQPMDFMAELHQLLAEGQADVTASDDQDSHVPRLPGSGRVYHSLTIRHRSDIRPLRGRARTKCVRSGPNRRSICYEGDIDPTTLAGSG